MLGAADLSTEAQGGLNLEEDGSLLLAMGGGIRWQVADNAYFSFEAASYSEDARALSFEFTHHFK